MFLFLGFQGLCLHARQCLKGQAEDAADMSCIGPKKSVCKHEAGVQRYKQPAFLCLVCLLECLNSVKCTKRCCIVTLKYAYLCM